MGSVSSAFKHSDFVLVCQQQGDIIFVISIVDSCVSESSGQMVLLPVVVPVSILVCTESKHTDLEETRLITVRQPHKLLVHNNILCSISKVLQIPFLIINRAIFVSQVQLWKHFANFESNVLQKYTL